MFGGTETFWHLVNTDASLSFSTDLKMVQEDPKGTITQ